MDISWKNHGIHGSPKQPFHGHIAHLLLISIRICSSCVEYHGDAEASLGWIEPNIYLSPAKKRDFEVFDVPQAIWIVTGSHQWFFKIPEASINTQTCWNHVFKSTDPLQRALKHDGKILIYLCWSMIWLDLHGSALASISWCWSLSSHSVVLKLASKPV